MTQIRFFRAVIVASVSLAGASILLTTISKPAMALCKYGTSHCVNPHQHEPPKVGGEKMPGSGWVDPDCKYYGNCNSSEVKGTARKQQTGTVNRLSGTVKK